jgi:soluble lytic murein transglycosylase
MPKKRETNARETFQRNAARFRAGISMLLLGGFFGAVFAALAVPRQDDGIPALVSRVAREHDLDPALVKAVITVESGGRVDAVSRAGARGLMQVMPGTASRVCEELGLPSPSRSDLFDPEINIRIGSYYLAKMLAKFGDVCLALGAYNAGPANVRRWIARNPGRTGSEVIRIAAYVETRRYVARVLRTWKGRKIRPSPADE